jgi:hypothetical protein
MSEIDRLNNSGIFPALPVSDRRSEGGSKGRPSPPSPPPRDGSAPDSGETATQRVPKSLIDEYA